MNCPLCRTPMADMADIADTPGFPGQVWECGSCRRRYTPDLKSQLSGAMKSDHEGPRAGLWAGLRDLPPPVPPLGESLTWPVGV